MDFWGIWASRFSLAVVAQRAGRAQHPGQFYPSGLLRTGDERKSDGERGQAGLAWPIVTEREGRKRRPGQFSTSGLLSPVI
jgi:hypothetical protein